MGPSVKGKHNFLETFEEIPIAHRASIGPEEGTKARMNKEYGSTRGRKVGKGVKKYFVLTCIE